MTPEIWLAVGGVFLAGLLQGLFAVPMKYTQQWSFSIDQEIGKSLVVEAQYLGSKGTHIESSLDYNATAPGSASLQNRLPYPKWSRVFGFNSGAAANYNALLLSAEKRFGSGLVFKGAYTFSKTLMKNGARATGNVGQVQNPFDLSQENGYSSDHLPHRFSGNFIYDLPMGRGKKLGSGLTGFADKLVSGWSLAAIINLRSGFNIYGPTIAAANCNSSPTNLCRPDLIGPYILGGTGLTTPKFDKNAFDWPLNTAKHPAQTPRFGSAGMNFMPGNGLQSWDMSIAKTTTFKERYRTELRGEFFNAFNHTSFANPINGPENPNFGRTFTTSISPRTIQVGLKFYW